MAAGCPRHRHQQVAVLSTYLSLQHVPDVLIHGRTGTGKTLVVRHLATRPRCAYVSCSTTSNLKSILAAAVSQFNGDSTKRKRAQGYALPPASEASLLWELQELCPQEGPSRILILDNITALLPSPLTATPGDLSTVLCALGSLRRGAGANLALWVVSGADPQSGLLPHLPPVLPVSFPAYSEEQVVELLAEAAPPSLDAPLYRHFLDLAVPPAAAITRALPDLAALAAQLWAAAGLARPANRVGAPLSELEQSRARHQLQDHLSRALARLEPATVTTPAVTAATAAAGGGSGGGPTDQAAAAAAAVRPGALLHQGLELPTLGKLLLLAAYLASRNAPSVDKQLWDNDVGGPRGKRRGGRRSQASDRQAEAAREQLLKGPHSFPLNRLLHIFQQLARSEAPGLAAAPGGAAGGSRGVCPDQQQQQQPQWPGQALRQAVAGGAPLAGESLGQGALFGGGLLGADMASAGPGSFQGGCSSSSAAQALATGGVGLEVLQQVQALVNQRLLSQTRSTDALEQPRYSCEAPAELVEHLAAELGVSLAQYLRYVV